MNNTGNLGITSVILLISFILIAATAFSVLSNDTTNGTSKEEIEQMLDDALDSITKYVQITEKIGKYYGPPKQQKIQKIAIMIKPLISNEIDVSELTIKLCDGNSIRILSYSGHAKPINSNNLFDHPIWDSLTVNNFGFLVTHDKDNSIVDHDVINKNTDMTYIVILLSPDFYMKKGENLIVQLFLSSGIIKTTSLEASLPIRSIVNFD